MTRQTIIRLLGLTSYDEQQALFKQAYAVKAAVLGKKVHLRGLIEFSNQCSKNCLYCGIRSGNSNVWRYSMTEKQVLQVVRLAKSYHLTGVVLQAGERNDADFIDDITNLVRAIKSETDDQFRITLSVGEQTSDTLQRWFQAGAQRYLLRIETSDEALFERIHPADGKHLFEGRLKCLDVIRKTGYQTGTGVMIGLPGQTLEQMAEDLLFIQGRGIDMVGMGPYLEHSQTPMYEHQESRRPILERFELTLRMIAILRLMMPTINIASTTALQSIVPTGRELGLKAGANVLMPNLTPVEYRKSYLLYENKPCLDLDPEQNLQSLHRRIQAMGEQVGANDYGDSSYYLNRIATTNTSEL